MTPITTQALHLQSLIAYLKKEADNAYDCGDLFSYEELWESITDAQDELRDLKAELH